MARKKKQPTQDVQENTIDTSGKLPDPKDVKIDTAFDIAGAGFLIHKAAEYYGKPLNETTLADAFDMMQEENRAEAIKGLMTDQQLIDLDESAKKLINATAETLGKDPNTVTMADIESLTSKADALSDNDLDYMSLSIAVSQSAQELTDTITQAVKETTSSPEYIAAVEFTKKTKAFLAAFSEHAEEFAEITGRAEDFYAEKLPFVIWELADRMGETIIFDGEAVHWSLEDIKALLNAPEKPSTEKTPFEQEIDRVLDQFSLTGVPETEYARELLEAAARRKIAYDEYTADVEALTNAKEAILDNPPEVVDAEQLEKLTKELPRIKYNDSKKLKTVTDKFAGVFFSLSAPPPKENINGQRSFWSVKYEGNKAKKEISLLYDYCFDEKTISELGLNKNFTDKDFFLMSICDNLFGEENKIVSLTKIWHEMGGTGSPTGKQLTPLYNALQKAQSTILTIDDYEVQAAWGNEPNTHREYKSPVLPIRLFAEKFTANGQVISGGVEIMGFSPFFTIAQNLGKGHITTWPKEILKLYPKKRTDRFYRVFRYLMTQIGWMRNEKSKRSNKILYSSLYEYSGEKTARAQQLTQKMLFDILDTVFIPAGEVKAYKEDIDGRGLILTLNKKQDKPALMQKQR